MGTTWEVPAILLAVFFMLKHESAEGEVSVSGPLERDVAFSGPIGCCGFAHDSQCLECFGAVRRAWRAHFLQSEGALRSYNGGGLQALLAETPRACALIGLHLMAATSASVSSGSQSPHQKILKWPAPKAQFSFPTVRV